LHRPHALIIVSTAVAAGALGSVGIGLGLKKARWALPAAAAGVLVITWIAALCWRLTDGVSLAGSASDATYAMGFVFCILAISWARSHTPRRIRVPLDDQIDRQFIYSPKDFGGESPAVSAAPQRPAVARHPATSAPAGSRGDALNPQPALLSGRNPLQDLSSGGTPSQRLRGRIFEVGLQLAAMSPLALWVAFIIWSSWRSRDDGVRMYAHARAVLATAGYGDADVAPARRHCSRDTWGYRWRSAHAKGYVCVWWGGGRVQVTNWW
jgi:hypothetical protein